MEVPLEGYDYIVIGGGTTGLVVASRLSEDPSIRVLVLEAGSHIKEDDRVIIPGYFGKTLYDPDFDWMLETIPQKHVMNRSIMLPRGRVLGGTSTINSMTWARASKQDYDALIELGNPRWGWEDWLPYMLKSETLHPSFDSEAKANLATFDPNYHSTNGPVNLSFAPWVGATHQPFFRALNSLGVRDNPDSGSGSNIGNFMLPTSIDPLDSSRSDSTKAYYIPASRRPNFSLIANCQVRRILFSRDNQVEPRALGVEVRLQGAIFNILTRGEVILSAGSYLTPSLLELSGIGDPERLTPLGIETVVNLPGVGENLQDHLLVPTSFELKDKHETGDLLRDPKFAQEELARYRKTRKGQYASIHSAFSLLPIERFLNQSELYSVEKIYQKLRSLDIPQAIRKQYRIHQRWLVDPNHAQIELMHVPEYCTPMAGKPKPDGRYMSILCVLMHALSRGSVHIRSADPFQRPLIDPNFLSQDADLLMLTHAVRYACRIAQTQPLASYISSVAHPKLKTLQSDQALGEYVKTQLETAHHPIGTASMLPREDGGVVDPSLKVYGVQNVRVVDASILPIHISAHPQATLYALGEKAADIFKGQRLPSKLSARL